MKNEKNNLPKINFSQSVVGDLVGKKVGSTVGENDGFGEGEVVSGWKLGERLGEVVGIVVPGCTEGSWEGEAQTNYKKKSNWLTNVGLQISKVFLCFLYLRVRL